MARSLLGFLPPLGRQLTSGLLQLVYPGACAFCSVPLRPERMAACESCWSALTADPHATCSRCGSTVGAFVPREEGCADCESAGFHFEKVLRLGPYEGLLRDVIVRLKHAPHEGMAETLGALWAVHAEAELRALGAQVVVPVPLHWRRRWVRGYNQSESLARAVAAQLKLPCRPRWLGRSRNTPSQVQQTATGRAKNVQGAFSARPAPEIRGKKILLIDDVMTTGNTASEAAHSLRRAGAASVVVAVLARG